MKLRKIAILFFILIFVFSLTGCKNKKAVELNNQKNGDGGEASQIENTSPSNENNAAAQDSALNEDGTERVLVEQEEVPEQDQSGYTKESLDSLTQVYKIVEAYDQLMNAEYELNDIVQSDIENLTMESGAYELTTKDGKYLPDKFSGFALGINYYSDFVSGKVKTCYNFSEYANNKTGYEIENKHLTGKETNTREIYLLEAAKLANYLSDKNSIRALNFQKDNTYKVSGKISSYSMRLNCDGDTGLIAIFDNNKKLLNVFPVSDDWDKYTKRKTK